MCQFCDTFTNNLQCPCTCRTSACDNTNFTSVNERFACVYVHFHNSFPFFFSFQVCPVKIAPVMYTRAASNPAITDGIMTCPQTCANQTIS